jgi:hypothetical protein
MKKVIIYHFFASTKNGDIDGIVETGEEISSMSQYAKLKIQIAHTYFTELRLSTTEEIEKAITIKSLTKIGNKTI